ncbi:hypothetical protein [Hymenobacter ruber]
MKKLLITLTLYLFIGEASAQNFTLAQLIVLHNQVDLPSVQTRLEQLGWRFSESSPDEEQDQVSWKHAQPNSVSMRPAVVNVFFCNQITNRYCDSPDIHADGSNAQHAFMVLYQPSANVYQAIKQQAVQNKMQVATSVMENGIRYQYTGATYVVTLSNTTYDDGSPRYFVELRRKTSVVPD